MEKRWILGKESRGVNGGEKKRIRVHSGGDL